MGIIQEGDVGRVLADQAFMEQVVSGLVENSSTMDSLADDIADKFESALESDPDLRQRLISAAISNEAFKGKLVNKLIEEMN